jgi:hypothetical protein
VGKGLHICLKYKVKILWNFTFFLPPHVPNKMMEELLPLLSNGANIEKRREKALKDFL